MNNNYIEYESNDDIKRNLSLDEYLNKIKLYLRNTIIDLQSSDTWKIQLTIAINFVSSKDAEEECVMHSRSNNIKCTSYLMQMKLLMNSLSHFIQDIKKDLETSMRGSDLFLIQLN